MILAIVQARMGSSRFPGKMLARLADKPLIIHALERVSKAKLVNRVILASTTSLKDKELLNYVSKLGFDVFAGSEEDVLDRFYQAAKKFKASIIVRITGDCPFIDFDIIDQVISLYKNKNLDYASNVMPPTYPDGFDIEVFSFKVLEETWRKTSSNMEKEL